MDFYPQSGRWVFDSKAFLFNYYFPEWLPATKSDVRNALRALQVRCESDCATSREVQQYKVAVERHYHCRAHNNELEILRREQEVLQATLRRREKETVSMLMEIITVKNQNKTIGDQLLKTMFEIKEDNFRNFSEDNLTLSSIEIKTMESELEMRKREKEDLQETLKRREKELDPC